MVPKEKLSMAAKEKLSRKRAELQEVLVEAVLNGHISAVQKAGETLNKEHLKAEKKTGPQVLDYVPSSLIKQICPVKYRNHSPLMMALEEGKMEIAEKLLELQASAAFKNRDGLTALHIACNKGNLEAVKALLETAWRQKRFCQRKGKPDLDSDYEVIINAKERPQGWTALMYAVKGDHKEIVQELWQNPLLKCSIHNRKGQNVFHVAVREGRLECLKLLHEPSETNQHLSAEEIKKACLATDKKDWNLLHQACTGDNLDMLDWLLREIPELKEKINKSSKSGFTPLLVACEYRKLEIVKFLINREDLQVDINACCHGDYAGRGTSALHLAVFHNAKELTELLVEEAKCSLEGVDKMGNNVLHVAYKNSSFPVINYITTICDDRGINLKVHNDANKLPHQVEEEIMIPPEIKKMGTQAVEIYKRALDEGKDKIPYCSMLILGKEQVGKTSLYRQLVGKEFKKDLDRTRGIDNTTVETVDRRGIEIGEKWLEKAEPELGEQFPEAVAGEMMDKLPQKIEKKDKIKSVKQAELMKKIDQLIKEIELLEPKEVPLPPPVMLHELPLRVWEPSPRPIFPQPAIRDNAQPKERQVPASPPTQKKAEPKPEKKATPDPPPPAAVLPKPVPRAPQKPNPPPNPMSSSTPPKPAPRRRVPASAPMVTPRQGSNIAGLLKKRKKKKEPPIILNTLDFAGQKEYRPMHHCFISWRGLYLVVFKIPDVLEHIEKGCIGPCPALVEVQYWVHSIHAHIHAKTSDNTTRKMLLTTRRILLVGTHRGDTKECDLSKVNKLIKEDILYERRYLNHIYRTGSESYFVPVENSIDIKCCGEEYLEKSGTLLVQEKVKAMSRQLSFLNEDYPIKWLKFGERLKKLQEERQPPIVTVKEAVELAEKSLIKTEEEQKLAFKFFHEAGKIICLSELPTLFLEEEENKRLADLLVLDPQWLMNLMKNIMELNTAYNPGGLANFQDEELVNKCIAKYSVLKVCWKDFLSSDSPNITMEHLCLIMQAHCLIYPVQPSSGQEYMVPFMLPEKLDENIKDEHGIITFYFQFCYFLPNETYYKLICLASEKSVPKRDRHNSYSQTKCIYNSWMNTTLMIEFEQDKKRLKFTVINKKKDHPSEYIKKIHEDYLSRICEDMEGLSYYGGPEIPCEECGEVSVLDYVTSEEDEGYERRPGLQCGHEPEVSVDDILNGRCSDVPLESKDLKKILVLIQEVAAKWEFLGIALDIKASELKTIEANHSDIEVRLKETIVLWLNDKGGERNWKFLGDALKSDLVERPDVANKLPTNS